MDYELRALARKARSAGLEVAVITDLLQGLSLSPEDYETLNELIKIAAARQSRWTPILPRWVTEPSANLRHRVVSASDLREHGTTLQRVVTLCTQWESRRSHRSHDTMIFNLEAATRRDVEVTPYCGICEGLGAVNEARNIDEGLGRVTSDPDEFRYLMLGVCAEICFGRVGPEFSPGRGQSWGIAVRAAWGDEEPPDRWPWNSREDPDLVGHPVANNGPRSLQRIISYAASLRRLVEGRREAE